jgi:sterol desaturase/sphingolipid hydroxylase (fatty acid hydroxylase superfamily)
MPLTQVLAKCGLLLSKRHHAHHHLEDNMNYAFLNGFSDPVLNVIAKRYYPGYKTTTDRHFACYDSGSANSR